MIYQAGSVISTYIHYSPYPHSNEALKADQFIQVTDVSGNWTHAVWLQSPTLKLTAPHVQQQVNQILRVELLNTSTV